MKRNFLRPRLMTMMEIAHGEAKRIDSTTCWISFLRSGVACSFVAAAMKRRVPFTVTIQTRIVSPTRVFVQSVPPVHGSPGEEEPGVAADVLANGEHHVLRGPPAQCDVRRPLDEPGAGRSRDCGRELGRRCASRRGQQTVTRIGVVAVAGSSSNR